MSELKGNAVIGQSGGPTAVINQSLIGAVEILKDAPQIEKILGAHHAVRGIIENDFIELQDIPQDRLDRIAETPSAALGSSREKPDEEYCKKILKSFEENNVRYFFYAGGNDSSDTCRIVNEMAKEDGYELKAFHIPKTIDNDLMCNDHTPGFGSAARFVACAFIGDNLDNRALPGIKINVVMGRHAGFLTAASALARKNPDDGPHLIYVPEADFNMDSFIADVDRVYSQQGRCVIAVSEGIHDENGNAMAAILAEKLSGEVERDDHGNVQLSGSGALGDFLSMEIKSRLGKHLRVRADTFGYMQRCFAGCVSPTDKAEARKAGRKAAKIATTTDATEGSIAIQRVSDAPYTVKYEVVNLSDIAAKTRVMPPSYLKGGNDVSDEFINYANPIVGPLPTVELLRTTH
jgi:6-phosphofructokinase 1